MIEFAGDRSFHQPVAEIAAKLSDIAFLVAALPDAQNVQASSDRASWKLKPKLAFIAGSLDTTMETTERVEDQAVAYKIFTKAIGATSTVLTRLEFHAAENGGTTVHWTGNLTEVTGLLKMVPKGLLQGTAEKVINDVWTAIEAKLA